MTFYRTLGRWGCTALVFTAIAVSLPASAAIDLEYELANHPDGNAAPPTYGFRLGDIEIFDETSTSYIDANLTWDLTSGDVTMKVTEDDAGVAEVRIFGTARGGIDTGSAVTSSAEWTFDVTYTENNVSDIQIFNYSGDRWELFILGTASMTGTVEIETGGCAVFGDCDGLLRDGMEISLGIGGTKSYKASTGSGAVPISTQEANKNVFDVVGELGPEAAGIADPNTPYLGADAGNINLFYELIGDGDYDHRITNKGYCGNTNPADDDPACTRSNGGAGWVKVVGTSGPDVVVNGVTYDSIHDRDGGSPRDWLFTGVGGAVPEPGVLSLMLVGGLAGVGFARKRRQLEG